MILVAGSANLDFVVRAGHIPAPGETVLGRDFQTFPGGKGANQAVACSRAGGAATQMLLALGADAFAVPLEASLQSAGVRLLTHRTPQHSTGTAFICVSDAGENAITVAPSANATLRPEHLPALVGYTHLLLQLEIPLDTVLAYAQAAQQAGLTVVLNAAPARELPAALLAAVDILVVNEGELAMLARHQGTVAECLSRLNLPTVVVTLGAQGCVARQQGQHLVQASFAIEAVDSTGAGDTFCGVLAAALSQGQTLEQAMRQASAAAALACTRLGAQSSVPTAAEVAHLLAAQPDNNTPARLQALLLQCGLA